MRLLVKHGFDIDNVSNETRLAPHVLARMMREPAVALAMDNWHRHRRLPPPCSPKKRYTRTVA